MSQTKQTNVNTQHATQQHSTALLDVQRVDTTALAHNPQGQVPAARQAPTRRLPTPTPTAKLEPPSREHRRQRLDMIAVPSTRTPIESNSSSARQRTESSGHSISSRSRTESSTHGHSSRNELTPKSTRLRTESSATAKSSVSTTRGSPAKSSTRRPSESISAASVRSRHESAAKSASGRSESAHSSKRAPAPAHAQQPPMPSMPPMPMKSIPSPSVTQQKPPSHTASKVKDDEQYPSFCRRDGELAPVPGSFKYKSKSSATLHSKYMDQTPPSPRPAVEEPSKADTVESKVPPELTPVTIKINPFTTMFGSDNDPPGYLSLPFISDSFDFHGAEERRLNELAEKFIEDAKKPWPEVKPKERGMSAEERYRAILASQIPPDHPDAARMRANAAKPSRLAYSPYVIRNKAAAASSASLYKGKEQLSDLPIVYQPTRFNRDPPPKPPSFYKRFFGKFSK
ncbi:hypothetical protein C8F01DRAFT_1256964 [Mycena amicta]|nr:hypothetical protein C8F01DRAFT_1256964 [Mycena amicta]